MKFLAIACALLLAGCACYPKVRLNHEHRHVTGAAVGAYCETGSKL